MVVDRDGSVDVEVSNIDMLVVDVIVVVTVRGSVDVEVGTTVFVTVVDIGARDVLIVVVTGFIVETFIVIVVVVVVGSGVGMRRPDTTSLYRWTLGMAPLFPVVGFVVRRVQGF